MKLVNLLRNRLAHLIRRQKSYTERPFPARADLDDIYYCFRLILGRNPNKEEWPGHSAMWGTDLNLVVQSYIQSFEFQNRDMNTSASHDIELHRIHDFAIYLNPTDNAVGSPIKNGMYEPHVTRLFQRFLRPGMKVLDIGANIGYFTLLASQLVGKHGAVHAIEPNPENCRLLLASILENKFDQISLLQFAASDSSGILSLNTSYSNGTTSVLKDSSSVILSASTVPCLKIDDYRIFDSGVDFIKIDIEGAEYRALLGAQEMIRRSQPVIVSEFSPAAMPYFSGITGIEYLNFLTSLGYDITVVDPTESSVGVRMTLEDIMAAYHRSGVDHIDILAIPAQGIARPRGQLGA